MHLKYIYIKHINTYMYFFSPLSLLEKETQYSPVWPGTCWVDQAGFELAVILLPLPPGFWGYKNLYLVTFFFLSLKRGPKQAAYPTVWTLPNWSVVQPSSSRLLLCL